MQLCLDMDRLRRYVEKHKDKVYSVYAGISDSWDDTSDEVYFHEVGWIDDADPCICCSVLQRPIAYIHYKEDVDERGLLGEFFLCKVKKDEQY